MSIHSKNLKKSFKIYKKPPGITGTIKSFFKRDYIVKDGVYNFNLEIKKGELVGLLGPNGAGKTTLMKMFTGIIVPSDGELEVLGYIPSQRDKEFRKKIALVMGQKSQLWWDIPAFDSFELLRSYYEIPKDVFKERLEYMSSILNVKEQLNVHVRKLSLGERMKLELMASLLHDPEIIFLDEPTIGLDLIAQEQIRKFIKDYHQKHNATIILTSHYMADIEELCQRIVLIMNGKKTFDGSIQNFSSILGKQKHVSFSFSEKINDFSDFEDFDPSWNENFDHVDLKIPEVELRERSSLILQKYPVNNFHTEKLPIEKVMKEIMNNPKIMQNEN